MSEKECEKKMKTSVVAELNRVQTELGRKTTGASTFLRHRRSIFHVSASVLTKRTTVTSARHLGLT